VLSIERLLGRGMAHQGFDSLTIDMQHGVVDYQVAVSMLRASDPGRVPLARVPWNDPARLMKILDAAPTGSSAMITPRRRRRRWCARASTAARLPQLGPGARLTLRRLRLRRPRQRRDHRGSSVEAGLEAHPQTSTVGGLTRRRDHVRVQLVRRL